MQFLRFLCIIAVYAAYCTVLIFCCFGLDSESSTPRDYTKCLQAIKMIS